MLNPKQEKFCAEYLKTGNGTKAYQAAFGVSAPSARASAPGLLKNAKVQERIAELRAAIEEEQICSAKEIQRTLTKIIRREITDTVFLPKGEQAEKPAPIRDMIRAAEVLGKLQGLFITRQELDFKEIAPVVISGGDKLED